MGFCGNVEALMPAYLRYSRRRFAHRGQPFAKRCQI